MKPATRIHTHEQLRASIDDTKMPSERSFSVVFAAVFALIALLPLFHGGDIRWWSGGIALLLLILGFLAPRILRPLNFLWFKFGLLLHAIVNPAVLGAMFFIVVTPMALFFRFFGKKLLDMKYDHNAASYWIERNPPGPNAESVRRQF